LLIKALIRKRALPTIEARVTKLIIMMRVISAVFMTANVKVRIENTIPAYRIE
jgi:hypothetical protein